MFKKYFRIPLRSLRKNKLFAMINILGLGVGLGACLILFLIIQFETSFDSFHKKADSIYRVISVTKSATGDEYASGVPFPLAQALRADYPQLENVSAVYAMYGKQIVIPAKNGDILKKLNEDAILFAEPQFFNIFDFKMLTPNEPGLLNAPYTALLSRATADKYFGDWRSATGKVIQLDDKPVTVAGILEDAPENTDLPLKVVISYSTLKSGRYIDPNDWVNLDGLSNCYVVLAKNYTPGQFNTSLKDFVQRHKPAEEVKTGLEVQSLKDIHSNETRGNYTGKTFSKNLVNVLTLIGVFLIVIACVNFINLTTSESINRSREIGIRKVMGSTRIQLFFQFMTETGLTTVFAMCLAIIIAACLLPSIKQLLGINLPFTRFLTPSFLLFCFLLFILTTLLSGFYPSTMLSGLNPISALRNRKVANSSKGFSLRRILIVIQFCIAQILIVCVLVIVTQMDYFRSADLGFEKKAIINILFPADSLSHSKIDVFRNELQRESGVRAVSFSFASPSDNSNWYSDFRFNSSIKKTDFGANLKWADPGYFEMYNIPLVAGRVYFPNDTIKEYVVNETLTKDLGFQRPEDALGKDININIGGQKIGKIVGVVKDFHSSSLKDPLSPVIMSTWKDMYRMANIKLQSNNVKQTIASIETIWNKVYPEHVFQYEFLEQSISNFYWQEEQISRLYKIFAGIAIFISCLGLYGFISFMAIQRNKEISIRKVLGASSRNIIYLLSKEFTVLIFIAFCLAAPIAYYFMHQWLQKYVFRIHLGVSIFFLSIGASLIIAWFTVGFRAIKSAVANPIKGLKAE